MRTTTAAIAAIATIGVLLAVRNGIADDPLDRLRGRPGPDGGTVHEGSWRFPRGGPYILGFWSPGGPATLSIDGERVVRGTGEQVVRRPARYRGTIEKQTMTLRVMLTDTVQDIGTFSLTFGVSGRVFKCL